MRVRQLKRLLCRRWRIWCLFVTALLFMGSLYTYLLPQTGNEDDDISTVLMWTPMGPKFNRLRYCGRQQCRFTNDRRLFDEAKAFLFYGSHMKVDDYPLPRRPHHVWALFHEESSKNIPFMSHDVLKHFNITSTISRNSHMPLVLQYLPSIADLLTPKYMHDLEYWLNADTPVVFMQSDCNTASLREHYVKELMRFIPVDSYGSCLKNLDLPAHLQENYLNNVYSPALMTFLSRYKFMIAFENSVCHDYITEKYWRPLMIGIVPIYFGSPSIRDWQPNKKSAIYADDFASPKELAEYLYHLIDNETEYNEYLRHKRYTGKAPLSQAIENRRLLEHMLTRPYSLASMLPDFECFVCQHMGRIHSQSADGSHYDCPWPLQYPPMQNTYDNMWEDILRHGRCQAKLIDKFLQRNVPFTKYEYQRSMEHFMLGSDCGYP